MSPQQAAAQTNQKFNLQTGSEAVYYPDSNTIGLPNAYLAGPTNKPDSPKAWGIVPRSGGGGSTPISAVMPRPALAPQMSPITANALAPSYAQAVPISSLMGAR